MARDFVSSGLTPELHRRIKNWLPDGPRLVQHLNEQHGPVRLAELPAYMRSPGIDPTPLASHVQFLKGGAVVATHPHLQWGLQWGALTPDYRASPHLVRASDHGNRRERDMGNKREAWPAARPSWRSRSRSTRRRRNWP